MTGPPTATGPSCPGPVPDPTVPQTALPPLSCDAHCHVFGPHDTFPYAADRTFTPPDAPREELRRRHDLLGLQRAMIVQSSCHGTDHAALLDALRAGGGRYRGTALVTPRTPRAEIARLDEAGVCGVRLHFLPHLAGAPDPQELWAVVESVAPFGWHVALHVAGDGIAEHAELVRAMPLPVVIDHMARVDIRHGLRTEPIRALLGLLDTGRVWVKLSGVDRVSTRPAPYPDGVALARLLAGHAPERVVWGTDFPHPNIHGDAPDDGELVDLVGEIAPDPEPRWKMLVANPADLFGFR
jgi:2-pyrone-4,6-dicarboxylate lactonase